MYYGIIVIRIIGTAVVKLVALFMSMKKGCRFKEAEVNVQKFHNDNAVMIYLSLAVISAILMIFLQK